MTKVVRVNLQSLLETQGSGYKIKHNGFKLSAQHTAYTAVQRSFENRDILFIELY